VLEIAMTILIQDKSYHPYLPGWKLARLSIPELMQQNPADSIFGVLVSREQGQSLIWALEDEIGQLPERTLIGIDLAGVSSMDIETWQNIGPNLCERITLGELGYDKRLEYLVGESSWLANDLQWAFERAANNDPNKTSNKAAIVPATEKGYCGLLAPIYADALEMVNMHGSLSSLELYSRLQRHYNLAPAHADRCMFVLNQLGLLYRYSAISRPEFSYDLGARGYALNVPEEAFRNTPE